MYHGEDGYGHGRVVYYAATIEEDTLRLRKMMQCFKESNPKFTSTLVVVIDKDFAEWKMLREEFPNSVVLFCQWHVLKVLFKQLADAGVEKGRRDVARNAIRSLMHGKDKEEYDLKNKRCLMLPLLSLKDIFWTTGKVVLKCGQISREISICTLAIQLITDLNPTIKS